MFQNELRDWLAKSSAGAGSHGLSHPKVDLVHRDTNHW